MLKKFVVILAVLLSGVTAHAAFVPAGWPEEFDLSVVDGDGFLTTTEHFAWSPASGYVGDGGGSILDDLLTTYREGGPFTYAFPGFGGGFPPLIDMSVDGFTPSFQVPEVATVALLLPACSLWLRRSRLR